VPDDTTSQTRSPRIFHGWYIVGIAVTSSMLLSGFQTYAFSFFFKPMSEDLDISRSALSAVFLIRAVIMGFLALPIGMAVDRYGPRALVTIGILIGGLATMGMAWVSGLLSFYLVFGVIRAFSLTLSGAEVTTTVVAKWFIHYRARALAISAIGVPLAGVLLAPLAALLINLYGWRNSFIIFGAATLVILVVPAWLKMRRMPEDMGLYPDGRTPEEVETRAVASGVTIAPERNWTMGEAVRTPALWLITISLNLTIFMTSSITLHQVPYMSDKGFSATIAASAVILMTFMAVLAKFFWGYMAERYPFRYCMFASQLFDAVGVTLLLTASTNFGILAYAFTMGIGRSEGLWNAHAYSTYFGRRFLGSTRGIVAPIRIVASGGGPLVTGLFFDANGDYVTIFRIFIGVTLLGAVCSLLATPPKVKERVESEVV
jgi:sugar phosphate permease